MVYELGMPFPHACYASLLLLLFGWEEAGCGGFAFFGVALVLPPKAKGSILVFAGK